MKITVDKLRELDACDSGIEYFKSKHSDGVELTDLIREDIGTNNWTILEYADWLITHCMTHEQRIDYALYAARLVFPAYQEKYPNDPRVRNYIQAIKDFRDGKIMKGELQYAANAAAEAAYTALAPYAAYAAYAAAHAAYAAHAAAGTFADKNAMMIKILEYGVTLLEAGNENNS